MFQTLKQLYWDFRFGGKRLYSLRYERAERVLEILGFQWRWSRGFSRYDIIRWFNRFDEDFSEEDQRYYLDVQFKEALGRTVNWENPQTFNEKIQWLKLYYHNPLMTQCSDKIGVRQYVSEKIGEQYIVPILGIYTDPDEIDFDALPNRFVLKVNWGSGQNIICHDKSQLNIPETKQQLREWMLPQKNYYYNHLEWGYKNIVPKILCEQYFENDAESHDIYDYKFFCFNGKVKYIMFLAERQTGLKMAFYDTLWNKMDFVYHYPRYEKDVQKPNNLEEMINCAEILANQFPHVRVDFFRLNDGKYYIGELTFYSKAGNCDWTPPEWDLKLGQMLQLPEKWV